MRGSYKLDIMRDTIILNGNTKRMRGDYNISSDRKAHPSLEHPYSRHINIWK